MMKQETGKVEDFMTADPVTISNSETLKDGIELMAEKGVGNLIVTDGASIGLLTEREILNYLDTFQRIPDKMLGDIMLRKFTKVATRTSIPEAAHKMLSSKTRLLVYESDRLVGIITTSDLLRGLFKTSGQNPDLDGVLSRNVFSLDGRSSVKEAIGLMNKKRIGSVIITTDGSYDGIFTERDLLKKILAPGGSVNQPVGKYYSQYMITARSGIRGADAARLMLNNTIKRLPITNKGKIAAMVTARDIVEAFVMKPAKTRPNDCDPIC
jgi:CBS domain-containing protein